MRGLSFAVVLTLLLASAAARASVCLGSTQMAPHGWKLDHYAYDASLKQDWEVLIDCDHPAAPAQVRLAPQRVTSSKSALHADLNNTACAAIQPGTSVEVSGSASAPVSIHLRGRVMQTAFEGQAVRVRLNSSGRFVIGRVRGCHSVELATDSLHWSQQ